MLLAVVALLAVASAPLTGADLARLGSLRLRRSALLVVGLGLQTMAITVVPNGGRAWHVAAHVGSYVLCAIWLGENRKTPGLWLVGLGATLNATAIILNGGIMPASAAALSAAGMRPVAETFANSTPTAHPHLLILGDVFALPRSWPLHNVFSVGDVAIALGAFLVVQRVCRRSPGGIDLATPGAPAASGAASRPTSTFAATHRSDPSP